MTCEETVDKIRKEAKENAIKAFEAYTPTPDHYIPFRFFDYYLTLAFSIGYNEGRKQTAHGKRVRQMLNGKEIKIWESQQDAANVMKVTKGSISKAVSKNTKCAGYMWENV